MDWNLLAIVIIICLTIDGIFDNLTKITITKRIVKNDKKPYDNLKDLQ